MSKKPIIVPVPLGYEETLAIHKENMKSLEFRKNLREAIEAGEKMMKKVRKDREKAKKNNEEPQDTPAPINPTNENK